MSISLIILMQFFGLFTDLSASTNAPMNYDLHEWVGVDLEGA